MNWPDHLSSDRDERGRRPPARGALQAAYGEQTERALENFGVRGPRLGEYPDLVRGVVFVKLAAAIANARLGALDSELADAVVAAGNEVLQGRHVDQFVVPVVQGGGGTSTHMNVNEVLATLATRVLADRGTDRTVHPNDHVNRGQSTNDVMPTAIALAVCAATRRTSASVSHLIAALQDKAAQYPELEHLGRTCLQDAVALPVSAVHRTHAHGIALGLGAIESAVEQLLAVPLGATAVGTGLGAAEGFASVAVAELAKLTGYPLTSAENPYYVLSSLEPLVCVAEAIDRCGRCLARVGADLRLLASGPVGGIAEIQLPRVQAGSSIMPGKVNPVIPEFLLQVSFQVSGEAASARSAARVGELEVSAMGPVVTLGLLAALDRLGESAVIFADRCITGLAWNEPVVEANLAGSLSAAVLESGRDGYDSAARTYAQTAQAGPTPGQQARVLRRDRLKERS